MIFRSCEFFCCPLKFSNLNASGIFTWEYQVKSAIHFSVRSRHNLAGEKYRKPLSDVENASCHTWRKTRRTEYPRLYRHTAAQCRVLLRCITASNARAPSTVYYFVSFCFPPFRILAQNIYTPVFYRRLYESSRGWNPGHFIDIRNG